VSVGAIGAAPSGGGSVYAALSPYLNGTQRGPDAAGPAPETASAAVSVPAAPPFLNPAIVDIATRASIAGDATSPWAPVLYGDSGLLIQAYDAVALLTGPLAIATIFARHVPPAISPIEPVTKYAGTEPIDYSA
jgi:hypothetical protein